MENDNFRLLTVFSLKWQHIYIYLYILILYIYIYIYMCVCVWKMTTSDCLPQIENGNGKRKFVFLGRQSTKEYKDS